MKLKNYLLEILLAAVLALEGWQLFTLYSMRDEISRLDQKVTDKLAVQSEQTAKAAE
jgi:hypothetical protein